MSTVTPLKRMGGRGNSSTQASATPALGLVGDAALLRDIVTLSEPQGARSEAIRALRTHLIAQHINGGRRALAVCAPNAGAGCTFLTVNLAAALAQIGIKTLLIDADMRNPAVSRYIGSARTDVGLQQCLDAPDGVLADFLQSEVLPNLSVMYAGGVAPNPQELLARDRFREVMEGCLRDFDATVIDTPPANSCADARRISNVIGYSLVVARRDKSLVDDVKTLIGELQSDHATVVGTVLNEA